MVAQAVLKVRLDALKAAWDEFNDAREKVQDGRYSTLMKHEGRALRDAIEDHPRSDDLRRALKGQRFGEVADIVNDILAEWGRV